MDTTQAIEKANAHIAALRAEIEILEDFVRAANAAMSLFVGMPEGLDLPVRGDSRPVDESETLGDAAPARKRITDNPKPAVLIPAAIEILRETGRPMSRRQLHEALAERGLVVRGAEPTKTLGTILWRAKDAIDSIEGRGYWPKGDPIPPAFTLDPALRGLLG